MSDYVISATLELRDRLSARIKRAGKSVKDVASSLKDLQNPTISVKDMASSTLSKIKSDLNSLNGKVSSSTIRVKDEASSQITKINGKISSLTSKAHNIVVNVKQNGTIGKLGDGIGNAASNMMMGAGVQFMGLAGVAYGVADTVKTFRNFEYQMSSVRALTGASNDEFAELLKKARELGATTMFKASDVAAAEGFMALAGWNPKQIVGGLSSVLNLATASGEDLKNVSDIVTDSMTAFGLKVDEVVRDAKGKQVKTQDYFADIFAALMSGSNTTVGMAGEASKYSAPVISALFASQSQQVKTEALEDWALFTGLQANAGIKGSQSGTATRALFTRFASQQMNASAALKGLGIKTTYDEDVFDELGNIVHKAGETRRTRDVIGEIRKAFSNGIETDQLVALAEELEGKTFSKQQKKKLESVLKNARKNNGKLSDSDKATLTNMMAGQEALAGWLSVLMASNEEWDKMVGKIDKATGKAKEISDIKQDTLKGDLDSLSSAWEAIQITIMGSDDASKQGAKVLRNFIQGATKDLRELDNLLKDGFDVSDIGSVAIKVVKQLKDEFMDGSLLAGGTLAVGLYKVIDLSKKAYESLKQLSLPGTKNAGKSKNSPGDISPASLSTMNVKAVTVNVYGKAVNQAGGTSGKNASLSGTVIADNDKRRRNLRKLEGGQTARVRQNASPSWFSKNKGTFASGAAIGGLFGAIDVYSTNASRKEIEEEERWDVEEATAAVKDATEELRKIQNDPEATADDKAEAESYLKSAESALKEAQEHQRKTKNDTMEMMSESVGGAIGGVIGAGIGACLGGPVGMIAGEVIGTAAGNIIGEKASYFLKDDKAKKEYREERAKKDLSPEAYERAAIASSGGGAEGWFGNSFIDYQTEQLQTSMNLLQDIFPSYAQTLRNVTGSALTETETQTRAACNSIRELKTASDETINAVALNADATMNASATNALNAANISAEATNTAISTELANTETSVENSCRNMVASGDRAGAELASNINAHTAEVRSEWDGLASWFESLGARIGSAIHNMVAGASNAKASIGHNASGTSYWGGGLTEINEHGGEIVDLPEGSRIYPHATTMDMLAKEFGGYTQYSTSNSTTNAPVINISGNEFIIREEADIDKIAYRLQQLIYHGAGNYQWTGGSLKWA